MAKNNNANRGGNKGKIDVVLTGAGSFATGKVPGRIFIRGKAEPVSEKEARLLLGTQLFKLDSAGADLPAADDDPPAGSDPNETGENEEDDE
ncbi:MAG: hypothetical protein ACM3ZC_13450 [Bacteroidota bacterium]